MGTVLNHADFSKNANDNSLIVEVCVIRDPKGDIGLQLQASDANSNKKVFDTLDALGIVTRHGKNPYTQNHLCIFDTQNIETVATALVQLRDNQLLSQALFTDICANFPGEFEHRIDRRVADIVGVEPSQTEVEKLLELDVQRRKVRTYSPDNSNLVEILAQQRQKLLTTGDVPSSDIPKPEPIDYLSEMGLGKRAQAYALLNELRQSPECEGFDIDRIWTPEFVQGLDAQFAHLESETMSKHSK